MLVLTEGASLAQSGSIEIPLPADIPMHLASRIDLLSQQIGFETEVVAALTHVDPFSGTRSSSVLFYGVGQGQVVVRQRVDLPRRLRPDSSALDGDRLVLRTDVLGERLLLERVGGMWRESGIFGEVQPSAAWGYEQGMALSGDRAVLANDARRTIDVHDFPLVGRPTPSAPGQAPAWGSWRTLRQELRKSRALQLVVTPGSPSRAAARPNRRTPCG